MASTFAASSRVTIVGEVLGQKLSELSYVQDVYQPHPLMPGVETMRWLTAERGIVTTLLVAGAKWNLVRSWLLNTSVLIRVTDSGLRARVTPAVSLDYDFDR
jgi:3-hydroxymyristoyl/3-hydroxydecanoyl-(acyl carrier protein) dehydratase